MRDDRRMFIPEPGPNSNDGFATFAAWLFGGVMTVALIDRGLTIAWHSVQAWWASAASFMGLS